MPNSVNIFKSLPIPEVYKFQKTLSTSVKYFEELATNSPENQQLQLDLANSKKLLGWCDEIIYEEEWRQEEAMGAHQTM